MVLQIKSFSIWEKDDKIVQNPVKRFLSLNYPLMEEKLKAREKSIKPFENHQKQLINDVFEEEESRSSKKELDRITSEIFTLLLDLKFSLDHEKNIPPVANFDEELNQATAVSAQKACKY